MIDKIHISAPAANDPEVTENPKQSVMPHKQGGKWVQGETTAEFLQREAWRAHDHNGKPKKQR